MVFRYGVVAEYGTGAPLRRASETSASRRKPARYRAGFLLDALVSEARRKGAPVPYSATTPYLNTIPVDQQPAYPGDLALEHRIRSLTRWNALAMVLRANKES